MSTTTSYKDLLVWQKSVDLCTMIYTCTRQFPTEEKYGLMSQMRRAAVSIPSNIAEGRHRGTKNDYIQFLRIAAGSAAEIETQIEIAKRLPEVCHIDFSSCEDQLSEVRKMLSAMIYKMKA